MSRDKTAVQVLSGAVLIAFINLVMMSLFYLLFFTPLPAIFPWMFGSYGVPYLIFVWGGVGVYQLLYVIPLNSYMRRQGSHNVAKGINIGAIITALLCGSCFLVVFGYS